MTACGELPRRADGQARCREGHEEGGQPARRLAIEATVEL